MKLTTVDEVPLPNAAYTASEVAELDRLAIAAGLPGLQLMKRAGRAAFELLLTRFPMPNPIVVYCGTGNNGGDGYVVAGLAAQRRLPVRVVELGDVKKLSHEAARARDFAIQEGVAMAPFNAGVPPSEGLLVDALLGTGAKGEVREPYATAINQINDTGLPVLAVDIPSGLHADTGALLGTAVKATLTVTFIGLKRGLLTGRGPEYCGKLAFADLGVPEEIYQQVPASTARISSVELAGLLPRRARDAHKGQFGHVMVIGGDAGYGGAAIIAAQAAARSGAGLVSLATRPEHVSAALTRCPELMVCGVTSGQELEPWLARPSVLVIGPGLGRSAWSEQMLQQAANSGLPMIVDADALNMLAEGRVVPARERDNWLLTPHPGEAGRLLGCSTGEVQQDRFAALEGLRGGWGGTVLLKGAGTLVAGPGREVGIVTAGNPGMASGGMGDLLSGLLAGLVAQGLSLADAAQLGACLHAEAADLAVVQHGERGLLATDLLPHLGQLLGDL
jgi:ADP-dependent NAD(P)H-hydrate dehydratase / NAD(P)H-hydrate epimerase